MKSLGHPLLALACLFLVGLGGEPLCSVLLAQEEKKPLVWSHGLNFQVRKAGQADFDEKTSPKYGAEIFHDRAVNQLVYVGETGSLGVGTASRLPTGMDVQAPRLYHALEVRVRGVGEAPFTDRTKKISTEVFRDVNADNLVFISETGALAVTPAGDIKVPDRARDPEWSHGLELKVRRAGEKEFSDRTKKVALEVYRDPNTNHLFYVTHDGQVAVVPAGDAKKPSEVKGPTWSHAFEVQVRKAEEEKFTAETKLYGVEVYRDENVNMLIYVTETGALAVVPAAGAARPASSKEPKWLYGRSFRVRKADERDFRKDTQRFGAEVYRDENSGNLLYLSEKGSIAAFKGK